MTCKVDYSTEEWELLTSVPEMVGLGMLAVSNAGLIGKLRELVVLSRCLSQSALPIEFAHNELALALLEDSDAAERATQQDAASQSRGAVAELIEAMARARLRLLSRCEEVADLLAAKSPMDEADGVKRWLLWIGQRVAEASGERWFGLGRKMTDAKLNLLAEIAAALRISASMQVPTAAQLDALLGTAPFDGEYDC